MNAHDRAASSVREPESLDSVEPRAPDAGRHPLARAAMQVLWPAFLGAAVTSGALFSLVDPSGLEPVIERLGGSPEAAYTVGFLGLWAAFGVACALTWTLAGPDAPDRDGPPRPARD